MTRALVAINVASLSAEPSSSSELVTQAVSGAGVTVLETRDGFCHVATEDRYQGWIAQERLAPVWDDSDHLKTGIATLFAEVYPEPDSNSEMLTKLVVGTRIAVAHRAEVGDWTPILLPDKQLGYVHQVCLNVTHGETQSGTEFVDQKARRAINVPDLKRRVIEAVGRQAVGVGKKFIGTPYLWGGCTPFGIDCSGFTQLAYKLSGIQLLRDAGLQFEDKRFVAVDTGKALDEADFMAGDLVMFRKRADGQVTHVGMALGDGRFLHSSGDVGVHIDPCTQTRYRDTFTGAVRLSPDADLAVEAA
ncbi:MAG: C40 family peptidase [Armatimonadota bacterium]|nr:C40 family peptidase [Armatimonadota bacterium]